MIAAPSPSRCSTVPRALLALATAAALPAFAACRGAPSKAPAKDPASQANAAAPQAADPAEPAEGAEGQERKRAPTAPDASEGLAGDFLADLTWHHPDSELFFAADVPLLRGAPLWRDVVEAWFARRAPRTLAALRACPGDPLAALTRASLTLRTPAPDVFGTLVLRGAKASDLLACVRAASAQLAEDGLTSDDPRAPVLTLRARQSDSADVLTLRAVAERVVVATFGTVAGDPEEASAEAMRDTPIFVSLVRAAPPRTALWFAMVGSANALSSLQRRGLSFAYLSGALSMPEPGDRAAPSWKLDAQLHAATPGQASRYAKAARRGAPVVELSAQGNDVVVVAEGDEEQLRAFLARHAALPPAP